MTTNDRVQFGKDAEELYKNLMKSLYIKWSDKYDSVVIRETFAYWVTTHNHLKIMSLINKRKHRKIKYKMVKTELENLKVKSELDNFVESL